MRCCAVVTSVSREAVARAVRAFIKWRTCTFYVEQSVVDTSRGGRQADPRTNGPYRGMVAAPGSVRLPFTSILQVASTPGTMTVTPRWVLLCEPNVHIGFGSESDDYVSIVGFGRFHVAAARPVGDITPPVGIVIALDERT
jgi:hypothetical protein